MAPRPQEHTFYTALYHSLLFPNVVSDVSGRYEGSDGKVHTAGNREVYANFSEWDIYRSEVQLESLLDPHAVGDMVQSLLDDAEQTGWLPKWAIVGGDESQMNGDSADPIIADALAMGVHNFDVGLALKYMVKGATQNETGHGLEIERQYLSQYLSQHYVNAASLDLTSIDYSIGGSVTLEYAIDDFSIAQVASAEHDRSLASTMSRRAANWEYLFNPATGSIQARGADGSFPAGAAFEASQLEPGGQLGFEEGNAVQYTWYVPQDFGALASLMGGDAAAAAKLETFMSSLNATRDVPEDWSGNEPDEWAPWAFDYFGAPDETQRFVRAIADSEYADAPVDEPGNDDLGALSSWYVWAAIGLFPVTPGEANLALASPLFPSVTITLPDGRRLVEEAPGASASRPYVHALTVSGLTRPAAGTPACTAAPGHSDPTGTWDMPWLPASVLNAGGTLRFTLSGTPDAAWGSSADASPPSFGTGQLPAVGFSLPSGATTVTAGQPATIQIGVASAGVQATTVHWQAVPDPSGLTVTPSSGTLTLTPAGCTPTAPATQSLSITAPAPPRAPPPCESTSAPPTASHSRPSSSTCRCSLKSLARSVPSRGSARPRTTDRPQPSLLRVGWAGGTHLERAEKQPEMPAVTAPADGIRRGGPADDQPYLHAPGRVEKGRVHHDLPILRAPRGADERPTDQLPVVDHHVHLEMRTHRAELRRKPEHEHERCGRGRAAVDLQADDRLATHRPGAVLLWKGPVRAEIRTAALAHCEAHRLTQCERRNMRRAGGLGCARPISKAGPRPRRPRTGARRADAPGPTIPAGSAPGPPETPADPVAPGAR